MKNVRIVAAFSVLMLLTGCSMTGRPNGAIKIEEVRPIPPVVKTIRLTIQRENLKTALSEGTDLNSIRVIPLYASVNPVAALEYRLFDIRPESAFNLLGLQNSDILVAAHGYVVQGPQQFAMYVRLLLEQDEGNIEIRRGGVPTLLQYAFIPAKDKSKRTGKEPRFVDAGPVIPVPALTPGQEL